MLRALMERKKLDQLNKQLEDIRSKIAEFDSREAEIKKMIEEAESDEERAAVQEEIEKFEAEKTEARENESKLEDQVNEVERTLDELEAAQKTEPAAEPDGEPAAVNERSMVIMNKRNIFAKMDINTRNALFEREDVKEFLGTIRTAIKEKRSITGAGLLVPEVFLGLVRENIENYSKLYKHVNVRPVGGSARQVIMGQIPEAVWTDCCGILNELDLAFFENEIGCWKISGYFDICNAELEDSEIDMASELLTVLGQAIGYALDKAIIYGLGTRMPEGVVHRLAEETQPSDWPANARPWVDLHETNITKIDATGLELFQEILLAGAAAKGKYSRGERVWVMNEATYTKMKVQGMSVNAAGAIVSGLDGTMPVAGGIVEVLEFIPDGDIITGYFDCYVLAERAGTRLEQSEHAMFIQDRTVFKGTARYDGKPTIDEAFALMNIDNEDPTTEIDFAPDAANAAASE